MRYFTILLLIIAFILAAGCFSQAPREISSPPSGTLPSSSAGPVVQGPPLPMTSHVTIGSGNRTLDVSVESFEIGSVDETGGQELSVYIAAHNTGTERARYTWFSKLTAKNGKTFGGIKVSHGGNGARSYWINPNYTEVARDFVMVYSDVDLAALKEGATLDVYFMDRQDDTVPVPDVPDYHVTWTIDPGAIR